jgi:hypothetical protein
MLAGVGNAAAQTENPSADNSTVENCTGKDLKQAQLFTSKKNITRNSPGKMTGDFQLNPDQECPVVVSVRLSVPSGLTIQDEGSEFAGSWGLPGARFTLYPSNLTQKTISTNVFSTATGTRIVDAQITYWPEGKPELSKDISTNLSFQVKEPIDKYDTSKMSTSKTPPLTSNQIIILFLILASVGIWVASESK